MLSLNVSTKKKKKLKAPDTHSMDVPWCGNTLCTDDEHAHSFDLDIRENMHKEEKLHLAT